MPQTLSSFIRDGQFKFESKPPSKGESGYYGPFLLCVKRVYPGAYIDPTKRPKFDESLLRAVKGTTEK